MLPKPMLTEITAFEGMSEKLKEIQRDHVHLEVLSQGFIFHSYFSRSDLTPAYLFDLEQKFPGK